LVFHDLTTRPSVVGHRYRFAIDIDDLLQSAIVVVFGSGSGSAEWVDDGSEEMVTAIALCKVVCKKLEVLLL
jgi:hypothetical protein